MAFQANPAQLWQPDTQTDGLDSQIGGLFYNLDTQDPALPDFHEPAKARARSQFFECELAWARTARAAAPHAPVASTCPLNKSCDVLQELWDAQGRAFDEPDVDLPKTVAEAALQEGTFDGLADVQGGLAGLSLHAPGGGAEGALSEPAFKDTGAAADSDEDTEDQELPPWTCACAPRPRPRPPPNARVATPRVLDAARGYADTAACTAPRASRSAR